MTFENHLWLYLAPAVALLTAGLFLLGLRRKDHLLNQFAASRLLGQLTSRGSAVRTGLKATLIVIASTLIAFSMARPKWGVEWTERQAKGLDLIFVLDTSRSMLATDLRPTRLDRAKLAIRDMITRLESDRIGLVAFAGNAFLQTPPTLDYAAFRESLNAINPSIMTSGGSDLGRALREAANAFPKNDNYKICILLTDGEDLGGGAEEAAREAAEQKIKIHAIGIGTPEGDYLRIRNEAGTEEFIRDAEGHPVRSQLDESTLQSIAQTTQGSYYRLSNQSLNTLYQSVLAILPRQELSSEMQEIHIERFQWFLGTAIVLIIAESLIRRRKGKRAHWLLLILAGISFSTVPNKSQAQMIDTAPTEAGPSAPQDAREIYNLAHQQLIEGDYENAAKGFALSIQQTNDLQLQADALYNQAAAINQLGEAALQAQDYSTVVEQWKQAEALFKSAAEIDPKDNQSKEDAQSLQKRREALEKFLEQQKQENQEQDSSSDEDPQSDDRDSQQNQEPQQGSGDKSDQAQDQNGSQNQESQENADGSPDESQQAENAQSESQEQDENSQSGKSSEANSESKSDSQNSSEPTQEQQEASQSSTASEQNDQEATEDQQSTANPVDDLPDPSENESAQASAGEPAEAAGQESGRATMTDKAEDMSAEDISHLEAEALLNSLRNSERLLPFTSRSAQPESSNPQGQRDW